MKTIKKQRSWLMSPVSEIGISWSTVLNTIILLLAFFVLLPQLDQFSTSLDALKSADRRLVASAFGLGMSTLLFAALTYRLLAGKQIPYLRTLIVQIAGTFTNRLLPAGLGGLGINIRYLIKSKLSAGQAGSIAVINNFLGFLGHFLLVLVVIVFGSGSWGRNFSFGVPAPAVICASIGLVIIWLILWRVKSWRIKIINGFKQAMRQLLSYRRRPGTLILSLTSSLFVTLLYVACFAVCLRAVGLELSNENALMVFSLGVAAGAVTPTPGGLVGVEAGMLAGLIGYGLPEAGSLSAVLLYRLVTYWLPILPGLVMFKYAQYRKYI